MQLTVGQQIRRLREERAIRDGMKRTQLWLAEQVGVSKSAVVKWEGDVQAPGAEYVLKLAEVFRVPPETFVSQVATTNGGSSPEDLALAGRLSEAEHWFVREMDRISALDEPEWRKVLYRDSAASAYGRVERVLAERARVLAEQAGLERAAALRVDAETAAARQEVLRPGRPLGWDEEAEEEAIGALGDVADRSRGRSRK